MKMFGFGMVPSSANNQTMQVGLGPRGSLLPLLDPINPGADPQFDWAAD